MLIDYPDSFTLVQIHWNDDYTTTWGDDRSSYYSVGYIPTAWFDGSEERVDFPTTPSYEDTYLARAAVPTDVTIQVSSEETGQATHEVTTTVCVEPEGSGKSMRVYVVQVLDHWPLSASYSRNGFKQAAASEDIFLDPGESQDVVRTFVFDAESWNQQGDIKIIAWAQEPLTEAPAEVYQAARFWPTPPDCNGNEIPDWCDLECGPPGGFCYVTGCGLSGDCNFNDIPDDCEPDEDCNGNSVQDICDIAGDTSEDCNDNQVPDECDIVGGTSEDQNKNNMPDECEWYAADFDDDGDVDLNDFATFAMCFSNGATTPPPGCGPVDFAKTDLDDDSDVDLNDFATFATYYTG